MSVTTWRIKSDLTILFKLNTHDTDLKWRLRTDEQIIYKSIYVSLWKTLPDASSCFRLISLWCDRSFFVPNNSIYNNWQTFGSAQAPPCVLSDRLSVISALSKQDLHMWCRHVRYDAMSRLRLSSIWVYIMVYCITLLASDGCDGWTLPRYPVITHMTAPDTQCQDDARWQHITNRQMSITDTYSWVVHWWQLSAMPVIFEWFLNRWSMDCRLTLC